jgi:undecaprenyl-diphosphatase
MNEQIYWIQRLHDVMRNPFWDQFFILWNYVDSLGFKMLVIGIVWYLINRKIGVRLFFIILLSNVVNELLKNLFHLPRPCQIDPSLGIICLKTYGFPSGAAQLAILLSGILIIECKKRLLQILGIVFAIFLSFSRIYLGVHFFTDILGGLFVGAMMLLIYAKAFPFLVPYHRVLSFIFPFFGLFFARPLQFGLALGVALGLLLYDQWKCKPIQQNFFRYAAAFCAILGAYLILEAKVFFPDLKVFFYVASGFWFSTVGIWCRKTRAS